MGEGNRLYCSKICSDLEGGKRGRKNRCKHAGNGIQVEIKRETIDFRVREHRRELPDLSPELGEVTQPQAVDFSLVPSSL